MSEQPKADSREAALLERIATLEAGQDEFALAIALGELVDYYWEIGRYQNAEAPMLRRLALFRHTRGHKHTTVARCLHDLAFLYDNLLRDAEAEDFAAEALALWVAIDGYANGHATSMMELLARVLVRQGRYEKLRALLTAAIAEIERDYPRGYHDSSLASLVMLLGGDDRSAELRSIAARIRSLLD